MATKAQSVFWICHTNVSTYLDTFLETSDRSTVAIESLPLSCVAALPIFTIDDRSCALSPCRPVAYVNRASDPSGDYVWSPNVSVFHLAQKWQTQPLLPPASSHHTHKSIVCFTRKFCSCSCNMCRQFPSPSDRATSVQFSTTFLSDILLQAVRHALVAWYDTQSNALESVWNCKYGGNLPGQNNSVV